MQQPSAEQTKPMSYGILTANVQKLIAELHQRIDTQSLKTVKMIEELYKERGYDFLTALPELRTASISFVGGRSRANSERCLHGEEKHEV